MRKILIISVILIIGLLFTSCNEMYPVHDGFRVIKVSEYVKYSEYRLTALKGNETFQLMDSVHKYRLNDTIILVGLNKKR